MYLRVVVLVVTLVATRIVDGLGGDGYIRHSDHGDRDYGKH